VYLQHLDVTCSLHSRCTVPLLQSNRLPSASGRVHACTQRKLIRVSHSSAYYRRLSHRQKLEQVVLRVYRFISWK
jgi:hypothetical protein